MELAMRRMRLAVDQMQRLQIAPSPRNYTLWYEYFTGDHEQLKKAIDALLSGNTPITEKAGADLYNRFIGEYSEQKLEEMRSALRALITQLSDQLSEFVNDLGVSEHTFSRCIEQLDVDAGIEALRQLVTTVTEESKRIRRHSQECASSVGRLNEEVESLRNAMEQLSEDAMLDGLTGIANRRAFDFRLAEVVEQGQASGHKSCLIMIDIDHFKLFNDTHGHLVGDIVLRYVASTISDSVKGGDIVARYDGEEFAVILPNTEYGGGMAVASSIADAVCKQELVMKKLEGSLGKVTVSVGVSISHRGDTAEALIERAEMCLYHAKSSGMGSVVGEKSRF